MPSSFHKVRPSPSTGLRCLFGGCRRGNNVPLCAADNLMEEIVTKTTKLGLTRRDLTRRALAVAALAPSARLLVSGAAAQTREVKLGFNGDLAASPSAQSGQAAVLGIQTAL